MVPIDSNVTLVTSTTLATAVTLHNGSDFTFNVRGVQCPCILSIFQQTPRCDAVLGPVPRTLTYHPPVVLRVHVPLCGGTVS
jgi:hypothetical protein